MWRLCLLLERYKLSNYNDTKHKYDVVQIIVFDEFASSFFYLGCDIAGDGHCDDSTNEPQCDFDGGDCCLPNKTMEYCQVCLCYAENPKGNLIL